jgi:hypothetical protein
MLGEPGGQPRLADAGLAREQQRLPAPVRGRRPGAQHRIGLFAPPDQRRHAAGAQRFETAFDGTRTQRREGTRRRGKTLDVVRAEIPQFEKVAEKFSRGFGEDHLARPGDALQARREVRRFADNAALLRLPDPIRSRQRPARRDADARLQRNP